MKRYILNTQSLTGVDEHPEGYFVSSTDYDAAQARIAALEAALREARVWIEEDTEALRASHMPYNDTDPIDQEVRAEVDARLVWLRATAETQAEPDTIPYTDVARGTLPWKCKYCGQLNSSWASKCGRCDRSAPSDGGQRE